MKNTFLITYLLFAVTCMQAQQIAFPGAEGYGKWTVGGRGGRVLTVTNLNDSGEGSFRDAVEQTGARIVVFAVDGTIELKSPLRINNDSITIAGQSAPGDGICLKDYPLVVNASNVIVRYIRVRVGDRYRLDSDGVGGGRYGQKNVILDHLSVSWSIDECLSIYKTENLTVQWCLVAHSLNTSVHTKGNHGFGGIWGGYKATFHHNLLANHASRNPRFSSVDGTKWVDYRNNVVYNWGFKTAYGGGHHAEINMVNNYYKPGPASQHHRLLDVAEDGTGRYYVAGNVMAGDDAVTRDNHSAITDCAGKCYIPGRKSAGPDSGISPEAIPTSGEECASCLVGSPFPSEPIHEDAPVVAYQRILESVGCSFSQDSYDREVLRQVREGIGTFGTNGIINSQEDVGGWPVLKAGKALKDTDGDGMPDDWESKHGLNPKSASDASAYTLNGNYTNIEVYLNSLCR
ncbi:MAG: pectate lyase [Bacteroides oleiciplenus]|uniref:Pectate lyase n=1 Tax=Bacteroides stercorirosoris TaxID=871324 RepID=A0A413HAP5_9BACE|nr:pectate lyase [Bacteroides stercorirosoris]OKZ09332.1 MAG: pectate lyase [Bacteroides oleiciplenus]RGX80774.1 pectate lyase [Bacteroides stercorirosoris]